MEISEAIWQDRTQLSKIRSNVVILVLQLAALYEQSGRLAGTMEILWA